MPMKGSKAYYSSEKAPHLARRARALRAIANGVAVDPVLRESLKSAGLIAKAPAGWALTLQGNIALVFDAAR